MLRFDRNYLKVRDFPGVLNFPQVLKVQLVPVDPGFLVLLGVQSDQVSLNLLALRLVQGILLVLENLDYRQALVDH